MKIFNKMIVLTSATLAQDGADSNTNRITSIDGMGTERQPSDLIKVIQHYTQKPFDKKKYWLYGCNCLQLLAGGSGYGGSAYGQPVDALDLICKQHKVNYKNMHNNIIIHINIISKGLSKMYPPTIW